MPNPEEFHAAEEIQALRTSIDTEERIKSNLAEVTQGLRTSIDAARRVVADAPEVVLNAAINKKAQLNKAVTRGLDAIPATAIAGPYAPILALGSTISGEVDEAKGSSAPRPAVDRFKDALYQYETVADGMNKIAEAGQPMRTALGSVAARMNEAETHIKKEGLALIDNALSKAREELTPSENQPATPQAPVASPETNPPSNS
ncbi:MAG: hypothetical protein WC882_03230 [Candidatus Gracilibacteria bacterium]